MSLHPRLTELTLVMVQALRQQRDVTVDIITTTVDDRIVVKWKRTGVCPWQAVDQFSDPSCQNWTEQEQSVTPQQNNYKDTYATSLRLACGIYARKPRQNGRKMTSFRGATAKLGADVDNELGGLAPHQCR